MPVMVFSDAVTMLCLYRDISLRSENTSCMSAAYLQTFGSARERQTDREKQKLNVTVLCKQLFYRHEMFQNEKWGGKTLSK